MRSRADFFKFVDGLLDEEFRKTCEFEELISTAGASANSSSKTFFVRRDALIAKISPAVRKGDEFSVNDFLNRLASFDQKSNKYSDHDDSSDDNSNASDSPHDPPQQLEENEPDLNEEYLCLFCKTIPKNTVFFPCGHLGSCVSCWHTYETFTLSQKRKLECPICKETVEETKRIFV